MFFLEAPTPEYSLTSAQLCKIPQCLLFPMKPFGCPSCTALQPVPLCSSNLPSLKKLSGCQKVWNSVDKKKRFFPTESHTEKSRSGASNWIFWEQKTNKNCFQIKDVWAKGGRNGRITAHLKPCSYLGASRAPWLPRSPGLRKKGT